MRKDEAHTSVPFPFMNRMQAEQGRELMGTGRFTAAQRRHADFLRKVEVLARITVNFLNLFIHLLGNKNYHVKHGILKYMYIHYNIGKSGELAYGIVNF